MLQISHNYSIVAANEKHAGQTLIFEGISTILVSIQGKKDFLMMWLKFKTPAQIYNDYIKSYLTALFIQPVE